MTAPLLPWDDSVLPFQLDAADVRGRIARLDGALNSILAQHDYPAAIEALVAETALLTALIGEAMKLRWKLSLQIRGNGPARLIAADYYGPTTEGEPARIRAYASFDRDRLDETAEPFSQIGEGYFAILIDQGEGTVPYQGITPLAGGSLAACASTYFAQSEQIPTRFALSYGRSRLPGQPEGWRAGGMMLQHMPKVSAHSQMVQEATGENGLLSASDLLLGAEADAWNRVNIMADTVEDLELIGPSVSPDRVLYRLFHEDQPRIFGAQQVHFGCSCSEDKVRNSLSIYSAKDIAHMITDKGVVTADCQFCGTHYVIDPETVGFEATKSPNGEPLGA